jgi:hypothetical protein
MITIFHKIFIALTLVVLGAAGVFIFLTNDRSQDSNAAEEAIKPVSYVKEEYLRCISLEADRHVKGDCLNDLAVYAYDSYEVPQVVAQLDTLSLQDRLHWCHEVMHYMGWRSYAEEQDIAASFMQSAELCDSGMYHGVMEEYLRQEGLQGDMADLIRNTCVESLQGNPELSEGTISLCYHGLGHGLMYITTADFKRSLDYCDLLDDQESYQCYGGVFMEYSANKAVGPLSDNEKPDLNDFNYCSELSEKQKSSCLARQGTNNLVITEGNVGEAMRLCLRIDEPDRQGCFQAVGANTPTPSRSHADSAVVCKQAIGVAPSSYMQCIKGALGFVAQLGHGEPQDVLEFCDASEESEREYCYKQGGVNLSFWLKPGEAPESKCAPFHEGVARNACLEGMAETERLF